jgi:hypothetical protein
MYQAIKHETPARVRRGGLVRVEGLPDQHAIYLHALNRP